MIVLDSTRRSTPAFTLCTSSAPGSFVIAIAVAVVVLRPARDEYETVDVDSDPTRTTPHTGSDLRP